MARWTLLSFIKGDPKPNSRDRTPECGTGKTIMGKGGSHETEQMVYRVIQVSRFHRSFLFSVYSSHLGRGWKQCTDEGMAGSPQLGEGLANEWERQQEHPSRKHRSLKSLFQAFSN